MKTYANANIKHFTAFPRNMVSIDMSSVRWYSTADVASPRPRKVGGACRIQVLAIARTQETVGGPNEAARSEFRRDGLPVGVKSPLMHYILA